MDIIKKYEYVDCENIMRFNLGFRDKASFRIFHENILNSKHLIIQFENELSLQMMVDIKFNSTRCNGLSSFMKDLFDNNVRANIFTGIKYTYDVNYESIDGSLEIYNILQDYMIKNRHVMEKDIKIIKKGNIRVKFMTENDVDKRLAEEIIMVICNKINKGNY